MSALTARPRLPSPPRPCQIVLSEEELEQEIIPDSERALEIQSALDGVLLETLLVTRKPVVRLGEPSQRRRGNQRRRIGIDLELPALLDRGAPRLRLPVARFPLCVLEAKRVATYAIHIPPGFEALLLNREGAPCPLSAATGSIELPGTRRYLLGPLESLHLSLGAFSLELRYVRRRELPVSG